MPDEKESFYSGRKLLPTEYSKLKTGIKPTDLDDKWFVYFNNGSIYFHRSWSGHCIFIVKVENEKDDIILGEVVVNRNSAQFGTNDNEPNRDMFNKLVDFVIRRN